MRIVVIGAGAIGGALGGRLALAGADVLLVARGAHLAAMQAGGLRLDTPEASQPIAVTAVAAVGDWRDDDVVLLATKTGDAAAALVGIPATAPVVCCTNGLEAERLALRRCGDVHAMCVWLPATLAAPGVVQEWSRGALELGRFPSGTTELDAALAAALTGAGHRAAARADVMRWKRGKLIGNCGNAAGAVGAPELRAAAEAEARACFAAAGLDVVTPEEERERRAGLAPGVIAGARRPGGSLAHDLARGRPTEVDYLNGEIVLLGRLHGVATPANLEIQRRATARSR